MAWTTDDVADQRGRTALVTGANAGLGFEVAVGLARAGARVLLACRDAGRGGAAADAVRLAAPGADVAVRSLDLADLASVRALAAAVGDGEGRLDLLVANAGVMAVDEGRTVDGFEVHLGVNHLGHVALTAGLLPTLAASPGSRVVVVTSLGHRAGRLHRDDLMLERRYRPWTAYLQSKLANLLFVAELDRRLSEAGSATAALAAHPGLAGTELGRGGAGPAMGDLPLVTQSAAAGARPLLRAATDPAAVGGELYGPRWLVRGAPRRETPSRRARRRDDARWLWDRSVELTGASFGT